MQALDDASLKELGRMHTAEEALAAVAIARQSSDRYSFDLIYARPRQTPQQWEAELKRAIGEAAEHLSLYQLSIEAETPFHALHKSGKLITPDDDTSRALNASRKRFAATPVCRPTRSQTTRAPAPSAGTISCIGARMNTPASGRARTAVSDIDGKRHATMTEKRPESG